MIFDLTLHLRCLGLSQIALALAHFYFAKRFDWGNELKRLSLINRQIFHVHALFICIILLQGGLLCLLAPETLLIPTLLARWVTIGMTAFWLIRLYCQWFVYDKALWTGRPLETTAHTLFTLLWIYYVAVFSRTAWIQFHS